MDKLTSIQEQYERLVEKNYYLHKSAFDAYKSYLHSYATHGLKDIFDVNKLDLNKIAKAFGFAKPPLVDLSNYAHNLDINVSRAHKHRKGPSQKDGGLLYGRPH